MKTQTNFRERIASSKKTKDWHIEKAREIIGNSRFPRHFDKDLVNYDLVNGILNQSDFEYITKPYGVAPKAYLPQEMQNFPIIVDSLKALEGEMLKRPNNIRVYAVNPEAFNEVVNEKSKMIQEAVIGQIKAGRMEAAIAQNPQLLEDEEALAELEQNIMSPEEIEQNIKEFRDSYEVLGNELLNYFTQQLNLKYKFYKAFKHGLISGKEVYSTPVVNGEPELLVINPLYFDCDKSPDLDFIHDGEWAVAYHRMTPSAVVSTYADHLTEEQVDRVYQQKNRNSLTRQIESGWEIDMVDIEDYRGSGGRFGINGDEQERTYIEVRHCVWRSWYKVGYLSFLDDDGIEQVIKVPENYKINKEAGDLHIEWDWLPEIREVTCINEDEWIKEGVVEEIPKDADNPYYCPLPYTGILHNNLNSVETSLVDIMKPYQYFYNIVHRQLQRDLASDKGQKILANINQIPTSAGIDLAKWQYFMENDDIIWVNPNEEGNRGGADLSSWRSIDLTAARSIDKKIQLLEYIESKCKAAAGINNARLGQQGNNELVGTTQQQIVQSSNLTEPWFAMHDMGKKAALKMLLDTAKIAYNKYPNKKISYILSDMSKKIIELDVEKLSCSVWGVFVSNATEDIQMYNELKQLSQAAIQNQAITLSGLAKTIRSGATPGEIVKAIEDGERQVQERQQQDSEAQRQLQAEIETKNAELEMLRLELEKYKIDKHSDTQIKVAEINSFRFLQDQDLDDNGIPDQLELDKFRSDSGFKDRELRLKEQALSLDAAIEKEKLVVKNKEIDTNLKIAKENTLPHEVKKKK